MNWSGFEISSLSFAMSSRGNSGAGSPAASVIIWIIAAFSSMIALMTASSIDPPPTGDPGVLEQRGAVAAERAGDPGPRLLGADQVDGVAVDAEFPAEQRRRLAVA